MKKTPSEKDHPPDERGIAKFHKRLKRYGLTAGTHRRFREIIYRYYEENARSGLPWRRTKDPYRILVSEIMLQQTQIERVLKKYPEFIRAFPGFSRLAKAPLSSVLKVWQGMGYNRRALSLKGVAGTVMSGPQRGRLPQTLDELMRLPGVGRATASAVLAFAFQKAEPFIETNIRRVFLHFFFPDQEGVADRDILPLVEKTLDRDDPRSWYYALMDYGAMLVRHRENPNRRSAHYGIQPAFSGSNRQTRGGILRCLIEKPQATCAELARMLKAEPEKVWENLQHLEKEGFLIKKGRRFSLRRGEEPH